MLVLQDGYNYFQVDRDRCKGDRRSDGKLNAEFFAVQESSVTIDNVRLSQRLRTKNHDIVEVEAAADIPEELEDETIEVQPTRKKQKIRHEPPKTCLPRSPRLPDKCIKCAGSKRTSRLLWLHEFFIVNGNHRKKTNPLVYQALQFMLGCELPVGVVPAMSDRQRREIWVLGLWYVPAEVVRQYSRRPRGYMFHTELNDDDADKALYGRCPELVRLENSLSWYPMSRVERSVPRIVHADDVKQRRINVAGRGMHYVCGVTATEDLERQEYRLALLSRGSFAMYPEERLGLELNSPSMMWEHIEDVFKNIRECMSSARQGTSSATFQFPFLFSAYLFWKVTFQIDVSTCVIRKG